MSELPEMPELPEPWRLAYLGGDAYAHRPDREAVQCFRGRVSITRTAPAPVVLAVIRANGLDPELDAARKRIAELEEERENVRDKLSLLSSKVGNGLGDESRSTADYVDAIEDGIAFTARVEAQRLADAQRRISVLDAALLDAVKIS